MTERELTVRFCGIAGDGVVTSGKILANACAELGFHVMVNDIYSAEIRGLGKSTTTVRFAEEKVRSMGEGIHVLVALASKESIDEIKDLREGGCVIYDSSATETIPEKETVAAHIPPHAQPFDVPLKRLATQASGLSTGKNLVAMGALANLYNFPPEVFLEIITRMFSRKGEKMVAINQKAFQLGFDYCEEHYPVKQSFVVEKKPPTGKLLSGNEAILMGAVDCGLHFFAGYPITPATKIMELAARELPKVGGWTHQAEDEIAAISAVVGAGFAGKRAMTATAGPGLALMVEMLGLSIMAEIPAVIVDVQRGGPSTGMPTKVEQADLNLALYGGAGDAPRVVMAPTDIEECYSGIQLAFDLAEKYQTPVIFLSDLFLGQRLETTRLERTIDRNRSTRKKPTAEQLQFYQRFQLTDDGVSPLIVPGEDGAYYTVTGLEHTTRGTPNYEAEIHQMMTEKRFKKFRSMLIDLPSVEILGDADAEIGLTSWGSTVGAVIEAMKIARKKGVKTKLIKSIMIYPQDEDAFREFFQSCRRIIVPEMNYQGQYAALLRARYGISPIEMHFPAVEPVSPYKIADKILEVYHELVK